MGQPPRTPYVAAIAIASLFAAFSPVHAQTPLQPAAPAPAAVKVGVAAAVQGHVRITSGDAIGHVVQSGRPIYLGDVITTDGQGRLQILLLDETVFTIGPNSSLVIDEFVYDPTTHDGKIAAQVVKGTFRFVTGQIGHKEPKNMKVNLPVGNIGVRGTMVAGQSSGDRSLVVLLGPGPENKVGARVGQIEVSNKVHDAVHSVMVTQPGYGTTIPGADMPPTLPELVAPDVLESLNNELASYAPGEEAAGGAREAASHEDALTNASDSSGSNVAEMTREQMQTHLQQMADAGQITTEEMQQMMSDWEAWQTGDETTRQELAEKYDHSSEYDTPEDRTTGDSGTDSGSWESTFSYDGMESAVESYDSGAESYTEMTSDAGTDAFSGGETLSFEAFSEMAASAGYAEMMAASGYTMASAYEHYLAESTAAAQNSTSCTGTVSCP